MPPTTDCCIKSPTSGSNGSPSLSLSKLLRSSSCLLTRKSMAMRLLTLRRMPTLVSFILTLECWRPFVLWCSTSSLAADVAVIAAAEFDDPNLDRSAALEGILGQAFFSYSRSAPLVLTIII